MKATQQQLVEEREEPVTVINTGGDYVSVSPDAAAVHGYSVDEMVGMNVEDIVVDCGIEKGKDIQMAKNGNLTHKEDVIIERKDGQYISADLGVETKERNSETLIVSRFMNVTEINCGSEDDTSSSLDNISTERQNELSENIRVETPNGTKSLNSIVLDIIAMQNELEQARGGAHVLCQCLKERLIEEKKRDESGVSCELLRNAKEMASDLANRAKNDK